MGMKCHHGQTDRPLVFAAGPCRGDTGDPVLCLRSHRGSRRSCRTGLTLRTVLLLSRGARGTRRDRPACPAQPAEQHKE